MVPGHPSTDLGVIVYVALFTILVKLTNVPDIVLEFTPITPPVRFPPSVEGVNQE